jgi:hypothetical protein
MELRMRIPGSQRPVQQFNDQVRLVVVSPTGRACSFSAHDECGRILVESSRQPLLDACRALIAEGADPNAWVIMRHQGSDVDALRSKVGLAARLTVMGTSFVPLEDDEKEPPRLMPAPHSARIEISDARPSGRCSAA